MSERVGCYPGSFDPPTVAHVAIAEAARRHHSLDRVDLVVSTVALVKGSVSSPTLDERLGVLNRLAARIGWLGVVCTDLQLVADLAAGYDVVILGADKWAQVTDPAFYQGDPARRDDAVARLPEVVVAPRPPWIAPAALLLDVDPRHATTSSSRARQGEHDLMVPEARAFEERTGRWASRHR